MQELHIIQDLSRLSADKVRIL